MNGDNNDDDNEMSPSDFPSLGLVRRNSPFIKKAVSPTSVIDTLVTGYEKDKQLEEMNAQSLSLISNLTQDDMLPCGNLLDPQDDAPLPDFTSDILQNRNEFKLPEFDTNDEELDEELALLERDLSCVDSQAISTPSGTFRNHQVPPPPNDKHVLKDSPLSFLFDLPPTDPALRCLTYSLDAIAESRNDEAIKASPISSPSMYSLDNDSNRTQVYEEPLPFRHAQTCDETKRANTAVDTEYLNGVLATNSPKKSDDANKYPSCQRFSPSIKDQIRISLSEITERDVYCGQHEKDSVHSGNVKYRALVADNSPIYQTFASKERRKKTRMRNEIIEKVGGRFVLDLGDGYFCVLTRAKVNAKVSQALRDYKKGMA